MALRLDSGVQICLASSVTARHADLERNTLSVQRKLPHQLLGAVYRGWN